MDCIIHTFSILYMKDKSVRGILVRGVSAPLPREAKKIMKFDYKMVYSEVYLNKYVVSIAVMS